MSSSGQPCQSFMIFNLPPPPSNSLPSAPEPSLCLDVIVSLFDLLPERSDVVALASTCKVMNCLGAKHILASGVEIEDDDALLSFCRFMLADLERRGPHLRKLALSIETDVLDWDEWGSSGIDTPSNLEWETGCDEGMDTDTDMDTVTDDMETDCQEEEEGRTELSGARLLARVLRGATRLEDLDIGSPEELMQRGGEDLRGALVSLPALRRLRTATLGLGTLSVVRAMTAPLVEIDLDFRYYNLVTFADMFDVLQHPAFGPTLEKITVWHVSLGGRDLVWHQLKDKPRFPRVHTLAVRSIDDGIYLPALVHAFPHLRNLDLTDAQCRDGDIDVSAEHARNRTVALDNYWRNLKNLCGDTDALYALGLMRRVPRVDVSDVRLTDEGVMRLRSIFPAALRIGHLALDFNAAPGDPAWTMMKTFEEKKYSFLDFLPSLRHLILRISEEALLETPEEGPSDQESEPHPFTGESEKCQVLAHHADLISERRPGVGFVSFEVADEELGLPGTSHSFGRLRDACTGTVCWKALPPEGVKWYLATQGMQWHRRPAYAEWPATY
ncbi:hypothetical protein LXA43DRAFT_1092682 [Ganoderma leucocontextum]|nr:hypothetical protein LXA43DRAFT_1092682 [Ganoderma leucocontextum]